MNKARVMGRLYAPPVVALTAIAAIMLHAWRPGAVIMQGDSVYFPAPFTQLGISFLAWNHVSALAGSYSQTVCYTLLLLVSGCLHAIVGYSFSQIVLLWMLIGGAWLGAYRLARRCGASRYAASVSAWLYAINPWAQQFYAYNYQLQVLVVCIPFIVLWMTDAAADGPRARTAFVLRFALFAALPASVLGINPALLALAIFVLVPCIPLAAMIGGRARPLLLSCAAALPVSLVAAAWWLVPTVWADSHSAVTAELSPTAWSWVTAHSSFLDNLRFEPTWWWKTSYVPYCDALDGNILLYGAQFAAVSLMLFALAHEKREDRRDLVVYAGLCVIFALFVSKGYHEPIAWLNEAFFKIPGAFFFREPTTKAPLLALVMLIPAVAFGIDALRERAARAWSVVGVRGVGAVVLAAALAAGYPTVSGVVFHEATDEVPGLYATVPAYWRDMAAALNADPRRGGVLMLPFEDFYQVNYGWFYGADSIADWLLNRPVVHLGDAGYAYTESAVQQSLERQLAHAVAARDPHLADLCRLLGIRYVLYRGDVSVAPELRVTLDDVRALVGKHTVRRFGRLSVAALDTDADAASVEHRTRFNAGRDAGLLSMLAATDGTARTWPIPERAAAAGALAERTRVERGEPRVVRAAAIVATDAPLRARLEGERFAWHAAYNDEASRTVALTHDVFSGAALRDGYPIPAILGQSYSESGRHRTYRLFNPAASAVPMKLRLTAHVAGRTRYVVATGGRTVSATVDPRSNIDWIDFPAVRVPAGQSTLAIDWRPARGRPDVLAVPDLSGAFLGVLQFEPQAIGKAPPVEISRRVNLADESDHALVGTVPIERKLRDAPDMYLGIGTGTFIAFTGVVYDVERGGRRYLIYAHSYASNIVLETRKNIAQAFERAHLPLRRRDFADIVVHSVAPDAAFLDRAAQGDPGIVGLTEYADALDRGVERVPALDASAPSRRTQAPPTTLRGAAPYALTGLNMKSARVATAELYSLHDAARRATLRIADARGSARRYAVTVTPGYSYVDFPVSAATASAIRSGAAVASFPESANAQAVVTVGAGDEGTLESRSPRALMGYVPIGKTLDRVPAARLAIDATRSAPGAYWGVVWEAAWRGKTYLAYQHAFIPGMELDARAAVTQTLERATGVAPIAPAEITIRGAAATASLPPGARGRVRIAALQTYAGAATADDGTESWNFAPSRPLLGRGDLDVALCGKNAGFVVFDLLDGNGVGVAQKRVETGVFSQLSEARPRVGAAYATSTPAYFVRARVPKASSDVAPCAPALQIVPETRRSSPSVVVDARTYELRGYQGEVRAPRAFGSSRARIAEVDPGPSDTAFVLFAPAERAGGPPSERLAFDALPGGAYALRPRPSMRSGIAMLPEGYDPLWLAVGRDAEHGWRFLPHVKMNGWANGYALGGESEILVVNVVNAAEAAALLLSLACAAVASVGLYRLRGKLAVG